MRSYGEDIAHWSAVAEACRRGEIDDYIEEWILGPTTHEDYLTLIGTEHLLWLEGRVGSRCRGRPTPTPTPSSSDAFVTPWEQAAALGAREVEAVVAEVSADAVLAGAGVANLSAWVAVARARAAGSQVVLTAELGLWGYEPTPADPYIFNQRVFPSTPVSSPTPRPCWAWSSVARGRARWAAWVRPRWTATARSNSTQLAGGRFLVGSGGANDVATRATACVVITLAQPERLPETAGYVTSPGPQRGERGDGQGRPAA